MDAPLSSPSSLSQPTQYFQGVTPAPPPSSTSQASSYTSHQPATSTSSQAQASNQQQQTQNQRGATTDNTDNTASPFLRDFNLVAEAAKRAQMAVLMRDMEAVGL